jgi:hypothetical protein
MAPIASFTAANPMAASPVDTIGTRVFWRISPSAVTSAAATFVPPISTPTIIS